jgi:hypothetical protein
MKQKYFLKFFLTGLLSLFSLCPSFGQGSETFTNLNASGGGYNSGSYSGDNSITWSYDGARKVTSTYNITGTTIGFGSSGTRNVTATSDANGVGDMTYSVSRYFTGGTASNRSIEVYVNGSLYDSYTLDAEGPVYTRTFSANEAGSVSIEFRSVGTRQIVIDDVSWTAYSASTSWTGNTDTDWATASNWDNGVPTSSLDATIPDVTNAPIISASTGAAVKDLTINESDGLTISSGGSIIVSGTSSGNITYNRTLATTNWYLISSPVVGETYDDSYVTANGIASGTQNTNSRGIALYTTSNDSWDYMQAGETASFSAGTGYSVKRSSSGTVSFTGTLNVDNGGVDVVLSSSGNRFNVLGNPYTSHIASATFLANEAAVSDTQTLWVWNQATGASGAYEVKTIADAMVLTPAQGFFVKANADGGTFNFAESNQATSGGTFQRTVTRPEIYLTISNQTDARIAKVYYIDDMTTGFDLGYEGELFNGVSNPLAIYTHLVADSEGKNYQVQSLPPNNFENMIVPVGVNAESGTPITIDVSTNNFPSGINIYLEDKQDNSFTLLEAGSNFSLTPENSLSGIGRFYLHTTSGVLSADDFDTNNNISIYTSSNDNLRIVGVQNGTANLQMFNILGKKLLKTSFEGNGVNDINLNNIPVGIYIVKIATENGTLNRKIIIQ